MALDGILGTANARRSLKARGRAGAEWFEDGFCRTPLLKVEAFGLGAVAHCLWPNVRGAGDLEARKSAAKNGRDARALSVMFLSGSTDGSTVVF